MTATPSYQQTYFFQQFSVVVSRFTTVQLKPDGAGIEIVSFLHQPTVQVNVPVAPHIYRVASSLTIPFTGEFRGSLQFQIEPLLPVQLAFGALDVSLYYFLRPASGISSTTPRLLRYPLIDVPRAEGTFDFQATLYPVSHRSSFFKLLPASDGSPKRIASSFRTTAGHPVHLRSQETGRLYLRPRPNLNRGVSPLDQFYYLAPSGSFEIEAEGPLDSDGMARILNGVSGTEYVRVKSRKDADPGDAFTFDLDENAYAETFGDRQVGGSVMLTPDHLTSWMGVASVNGDRFYYAQPADAPLFQADGIFTGTSYLDFSEIPAANVTNPPVSFPVAPVSGVVSIDDSVDIDIYDQFERDVLAPYRDQIIKRNTNALPPSPERSLQRLAQNGTTTEKRTTPQGLLVDVDIASNRYTRLLLGKIDGVEFAISSPTVALQQALSTNSLFLVVSHLENVGDFTENVVTMSAWNFVADIAENTGDPARSIMIFKFADGFSFNDLVNDSSKWTNPDDFTNEAVVSTRLRAIIAEMRTKAQGAGGEDDDPAADTDADVARYYRNFLDTVIDSPSWAGIVVFDASLGDPNALPREIRGLLPGMVVTTDATGADGTAYVAPTNKIDPAFKAHHLRIDIARVKQASDGTLEDIENSSMSALIDYSNLQRGVTGVSKWTDNARTTTEVDAIANVTDFSFRLKFMRITFENSYIKNFLSDVSLRFHKLFKEVPDVSGSGINTIDLSGSLQQIDGIPTYVFRFGCIDPLKNNFIVCAEQGLDGQRAIVVFPDTSPVIEEIESTRVDYNMLQIGINVGDSNIAEFVIAGYMTLRELGGRDFFSYDRVGFGKLGMALNYTTLDEAAMTEDIAKPEDMGNPFWIFTPNTMRFDTLRGQARDGSIVKQAPITVKGIAESVSTFSAADAGVFPIPNLVPSSQALIPYKPASTAGAEPSPVTYIISYGMSIAGIGLNVASGGLMDITIHTGWVPGGWTDSGENVFYTALQWGTPLTGLDIGKQGMFKAQLADFGFGEIPTSSNDRIFFIYVNSLGVSILKWSAKVSLMLFAPAPTDEGFEGAFGDGGANISSWFGSFSLSKGATGTGGIKSLPAVIPAPGTDGDPVFVLANAALDVVITVKDQNVPKKYQLKVFGNVQSVGGSPDSQTTITVTVRLYRDGLFKTSVPARTADVSFASGLFESHKPFTILFDEDSWPTSDETYTADVRITGANISTSRSKTIRQSNTVTLRKDEGKPSSGSPIVEFDYVGLGRGIRLRRGSDPNGDPNLNVRPAPRTVGDALQLMQQMLPLGESGPDLYNVLRDIYAPSAGMMVGVDITIMGWLRLAVVADEADEIYGGLLEIKDADKLPSFAKKVAGLRIEILYRRLWDDSDLGVYEGTLTLPDVLRYWDVGGFSVTVPVISLQIYTDGGFLVDLGFPTGSFASGYDFSRSFAIQGFVGPFPVMGAVGLYFGRISADAEYTLPDLDPTYGAWNSAWKFGLAAKLGLGKSYKRGPFSFEFSLTAQLVFQGVAAAIDRVNAPNDNAPAPADYLALEASLSIVLYIMGKMEVEKSGFRLTASLMIRASLGVQFRYMTAVAISLRLSVTLEAELKVELDLRLFTISISMKFEFKFQPTFRIPNNNRPEWVDYANGYPPLNVDRGDNVLAGRLSPTTRVLARQLAAVAMSVTWEAPGSIWDRSFASVFTFEEAQETTKLPIDLVFAAPFTLDQAGGLVGVGTFVIPEMAARYLQAGMFVWTAKRVLGAETTGSTELGASDLRSIRAAIDSEREELTYAVLQEFLDANYTFRVHSGDDKDQAEGLLTPEGASETAATIFPMAPDYEIVYSNGGEDATVVKLSDQTRKDAAYYAELDRYLESLLVQVEQQLGANTLSDMAVASAVDTKPLATHVFEAYFELLIDSGVEHAIEQKVPRAAAPDEVTGSWTLATIVADIINRDNPAEVNPVSALASRLLLGGHQLPEGFDSQSEPPKPNTFKPLFGLTGQQVPVALPASKPDGESEDVVWSIAVRRGESDENAVSTAVTINEYDQLSSLSTSLTNAIGFGKEGGSEPRIEVVKPYLERNLDYPVDERIPVSSDGATFDRAVMPFSKPLLSRLDTLDAGSRFESQVTKVVYTDEFSDEIVSVDVVATSQYEWALIVEFTAGRVVDPLASSGGNAQVKTYLKDTYTLGGTDEPTRVRIAGLLQALVDDEASITGVDVLAKTTLEDVGGLTPLGSSSLILKTNLSSVSAPRGLQRLLAATPPEEKFYGTLNTDDIFASLRLLWEASTVNAPGFFLEYGGENGLPDGAFTEGADTATLTLVIRMSSSSGVPEYANALAYSARPASTERFYIESLDQSQRTAIPTGVPGVVALLIGRDVVDSAVAASVPSNVRSTATLFNLMTYRIKDDGSGNWAVGDESWSLPFGPLTFEQDHLPESIRSSEWQYQLAVPWTNFLTAGRTNSPIYSSTKAQSPYDLINRDLVLELAVLDTYGNQFPRTVEVKHTVKYTDPLLSISQWPEVKTAYEVGSSGDIQLSFEFGNERFSGSDDATVTRARALRAQFESIWFQLNDPNTSVTLHSTLLANNGEQSMAGEGTINARLVAWVEEILAFLDAKVNNLTATPPTLMMIATSPVGEGARNEQVENIRQLNVSIVMSRPEAFVDGDAVSKLASIQTATSDIKPNTELEPDLPALPEGVSQPAAVDSLVGFTQRFENAYPEFRLATGESDAGEQTLWMIRMGRGVGESGPGIRVSIDPSSRSFYANAPLSTRYEVCTIEDPDDTSKTVTFSNVDMDRLGRRFVAIVDDMLSHDKAVKLRRADDGNGQYGAVLSAKQALAEGIPNGMLSIFDELGDDVRESASREVFRQALLKSLSAAYNVDTVISYNATVTNSQSITGTPPNLFGTVVSLEPQEGNEPPYVVGNAKIRLGNDANGNAPKLTFTFSTDRDSERAQIPANLAYQITYVEHAIQTDKPSWAPPTGSYEYRASTWLKLILPDNPRVLNDSRLPNDPLVLSADNNPIKVPVPLREIPTTPAVLRQLGTPEVAAGDSVTLDRAAAWEYEYQVERARAAQDRIYLHLAFNAKQGLLQLASADETLLHALCRFDLLYSRLIGADLPIEEQKQPTSAELLGLVPAIQDVASKWATWTPTIPVVEYTWAKDDWAYAISESVVGQDTAEPEITIRLMSLEIKEPIQGQPEYGIFPEIRVPDPMTNGPMELSPTPVDGTLEPIATYGFTWSGVVPDNQTRSFVFSNLNVLKTENARGRIWLTRNENLGELDRYTTNERFIYRSGASEFTDPVQPFIDRTVPVDIVASISEPSSQSIEGYLTTLFDEIFGIAIDNGYPWPLTKIGCRYGYDPRNELSPPTGPDPDDQFIVFVPVMQHVPFTPSSSSELASQIAGVLQRWEQHWDIANSPSKRTGFYEFDLSVFSTLNRSNKSSPMLRLRRLWIKRFE